MESHKEFLFDIFQKENPNWVEKLLAERERKKNLILQEWLEKQRLNPDQDDDDIMFSEAQSLMATKKSDVNLGATSTSNSPSKLKPSKVVQNRAQTREELIQLFEAKLASDSIDVPPDFYDEDVLYDDPEELMVIYSYLEEQNRKKISDIDDINEQIDEQKNREKEVRQRIGGEILVQEAIKEKYDKENAY